jgi:hypothetical protein
MTVLYSFDYKVNSTFWVDDMLEPSFHEITLQIDFPTKNHSLIESLNVIDTYINQVLRYGVCFSYANKTAMDYFFPDDAPEDFSRTNIPIIFPEQPTYELYLKLLVRKLNAIIADDVVICFASMRTHSPDEITIDYDCEFEVMPTINDMVGEFAFHDDPWWDRHDFDTMDFAANSQEEVDEFIESELASAQADADEDEPLRDNPPEIEVNDKIITLKFNSKPDSE